MEIDYFNTSNNNNLINEAAIITREYIGNRLNKETGWVDEGLLQKVYEKIYNYEEAALKNITVNSYYGQEAIQTSNTVEFEQKISNNIVMLTQYGRI